MPVADRSSFLSDLKNIWRKPAFHYAGSFILTVLFLYLAFRGTDLRKILDAFVDANYGWLFLGFLVMITSHLVRAWRWRYLLEPVKPGIALRNLFSGVMIGYFLNNVLPRAGELARPYAIRRLEGVPVSAALGTVFVERILDTFVFLGLLFAIPLVYRGPLLESFPWLEKAGVILMLIMLPMLALPVVLMLRRDWTDALLRLLARVLPPRAGKRVSSIAHSFLDGFKFLTSPATAVRTLVMTAVIWALYMLSMYLSFFAFGLGESLGVGAAMVTLAISSIGIALPTPGGTGTYHAFTSQTLTQLFGVDSAVALSYATATHAIGYIGVSIIGVYFLLKDQMSLSEAVKAGAGESA
jgi:uncharacterized protein (TIRG00374 family)